MSEEPKLPSIVPVGTLMLGEGGSARLNGKFVELLQAEIEQFGFILADRFRQIAATVFVEAAREAAERDAGSVVEFPISRKAG